MVEHVKLDIEGMTCDSCSNSITTVLSKKFSEQISNLKVSWEEGTAEMDVSDPSKMDEMKTTIERLGYKVIN